MNAIGFIFTLFVHFFHLFWLFFYIFPELTNHIREPKLWHRHFFFLFSVFLSFHGTRLRRFSVRGYTCISNNVSGFLLAEINLRPLKLDSGIQITAKWPTLQQIIPVSTSSI